MNGPHIQLVDPEGDVIAEQCIIPLGSGHYWIPSGAKARKTGLATQVRIHEPGRATITMSVERFMELAGWHSQTKRK